MCKKALHCLHTLNAQLDRASQVRVAKVFASRHRHVEPITLLLRGKSWGLQCSFRAESRHCLVRRLLNEVCYTIDHGGCLHVRDWCLCIIIDCPDLLDEVLNVPLHCMPVEFDRVKHDLVLVGSRFAAVTVHKFSCVITSYGLGSVPPDPCQLVQVLYRISLDVQSNRLLPHDRPVNGPS
jgi:hypothetical protein